MSRLLCWLLAAVISAAGSYTVSAQEVWGCNRLCWLPEYSPTGGAALCFRKLHTQTEVNLYQQAIKDKGIAIGKVINFIASNNAEGTSCTINARTAKDLKDLLPPKPGDRGLPDIAVMQPSSVIGTMEAKSITGYTQTGIAIGTVIAIAGQNITYDQKVTLFFPDPKGP